MSIRPVKRLIKSKPTMEGAGVHLRRAFGFGNTTDFDPFLLLDDFRKDTQNPGKTFAPFRVIADGRLDGFLGWFEARLCEGVTLSNSPYLPLTSWWQLYLPVAKQPHYHAGQTMLLYLDPSITDGQAEWKYAEQTATPDGSPASSQE